MARRRAFSLDFKNELKMNEDDVKLLRACQIFQFQLEEPGSTISQKGDAVRGLLFQLYNLLQSGKLSDAEYCNVTRHYQKLYLSIVDEQDESKGLNNYAEQSISLATGFKNDSKNWHSCLTIDVLDELGISKVKPKTQQSRSKKTAEPNQSLNIQSVNNEYQCSSKNASYHRQVPPICAGSQGGPELKRTYQTVGNKIATNNTNTCPDGKFLKKSLFMNNDKDENSDESDIEFVTARQQFIINERKKGKNECMGNYGEGKKSLGYRRGPSSRFVPPVRRNDESSCQTKKDVGRRSSSNSKVLLDDEEVTDERLKGIEPKMIELINNEIMDHGPPVEWHDIAGLEFAKNVIKEIVVWPMLRPDIFKGLRGPPKGLLLFGPPGTGKTLIGKCIASQSKATFFSISASSLTSKWVGEGEKMVRALFAVARCHQPAVIFIDEIDSLLSQRSDGEHDSSRRIKTEFLIQLDGAATNSDDRLLVVGATNRPQEIDEAARRRLVKRLYIPLPEGEARRHIITHLLKDQSYSLSDDDMTKLVERSEGYSGSDMSNLCHEAALGPIRSISGNIQAITSDQVRPIVYPDFENAFKQVRASVSAQDLDLYIQWNEKFGSGR